MPEAGHRTGGAVHGAVERGRQVRPGPPGRSRREAPAGDGSTALLALDAVNAGVGDTVLIVQEGWSASTVATGKPGAAIDSAIIGVVDRIDLL